MKQIMVVVVKSAIRETRNMNALVKLDLYYSKIRRHVKKVCQLDIFVCVLNCKNCNTFVFV